MGGRGVIECGCWDVGCEILGMGCGLVCDECGRMGVVLSRWWLPGVEKGLVQRGCDRMQ